MWQDYIPKRRLKQSIAATVAELELLLVPES
jgi:hypothetical protein